MTFSLLERKAEILSRYFIGTEVDQRELFELASLAHLRCAEANNVIFNRGDPGHALMIVISGKVLILATSAAGRRLIINIVGPGEIFGEITVIDGARRSADAQAAEATEYLLLERRHFMPYLEKAPNVAIKLLRILCHRVRLATSELQDAAFLDLSRRLAKKLSMFMTLVGSSERGDGTVSIPVTQADLGAMLGVSRESINKQLSAWRIDGMIRAGRGRLIIVKPDLIHSLAAEDN
jgi:CRP/FNR family cyclic AMP-dependent transcriptional regulator